MSGQIGNNILRTSGVVAATAAGLNWVSTVVTASTVTVEAGNGYFINTTSNTCTITLPSSAEAGDQIVFMDYLRTWGTNKIIIDSNGLNYQGDPDTFIVEYETDGETLNIVYADATQGWIPLDDDVVTDAPSPPPTQKAIFAYGDTGSATATAISNLVNSSGVVASDVSGVGTARIGVAAATYGVDKAIFAYGSSDYSSKLSMSNLVNNSGVVASDVSGVGTARYSLAAAAYGGIAAGKAIFGYGEGSKVSMTNLVTNAGVVGSDVTGVGTARSSLSAVGYGTDKAIFAYGFTGSYTAISNLVSNAGVVATDTSGVGTARAEVAATSYGSTGQAIFGYGATAPATAITNLVSSSGVIASDTSGVGTARTGLAASGYGGDKGIFGYGNGPVSMTNLVNSSGVVASDVSGVGTARVYLPVPTPVTSVPTTPTLVTKLVIETTEPELP